MRVKIKLVILAAIIFAASCSKISDKSDELFDEYILNGVYENNSGLEIEINGQDADIVGFTSDDQVLAKDPSLSLIGSNYIRNIVKVGVDKWEGEIIDVEKDLYTDKIIKIGRVKTYISVNSYRNGIDIIPNHYAYESSSFIKKTSAGGGGSGSGGGGSGGGAGGSTTDTVVKQQYSGKTHETVFITYTPPVGTKSMTIKTTEASNADWNTADMFVRKGQKPIIKHTYPPNISEYSWTADFAGINPNREEEIYTVSNPSGTYHIALYGYNSFFASTLIITITK